MSLLNRLYARLFGPAAPLAARAVQRMAEHRRAGRIRRANRVENALQRRFSIYVSSQAGIGPGLSLPHPTGIVIGAGVRLGQGVTIYQNVTLGAARRAGDETARYPEVGDNTTIFAGAVLVGNIRVGRACIIGANSVVTSDVPDGATAVGAPARILLRSERTD